MIQDLSLLGIGHVILASLLSIDILLHKHRPVSAVLWLAVVWAFPYLGALGYLGFGVDRVRRGAAEREASRELVAQRAALHPTFDELAMSSSRWTRPGTESQPARHILRATDPAVSRNNVIAGNRAQFLVNGDEFYPALLEAIEGAESSIHLQTFIFRRDRFGHELRDLLSERARSGVQVRLLYDRFGSTFTHFSSFFKPTREAGVRVHSISQANPLKGRFQINLRNHRKIAVMDGRIAFVGGINFQDENLSIYTNGSPISDYHVRIEGPVVSDVQSLFIEDWHFASKEAPEKLMEPAYFPALEPAGDALVQIVPGGPEHLGHGLADAFFAAIVSAEHSITIVTPYFVPDEPIVHAIRYAALRGVDVKLVVPKRSNHWYTDFAARSMFTPLLNSGVRIFERPLPFIHAKAMVVDGVYAMLGSANLDFRSLHLNFETNLEVVDEGFVNRVADQLSNEIDRSTELSREKHLARPLARRLAENFSRLFQPML